MVAATLGAVDQDFGEERRRGMVLRGGSENLEVGKDIFAQCRPLECLSLGGVAAMAPQTHLPRKYRRPRARELSTYVGAGVVPVTRTPDGKARILLWQPQSGKKRGVRWYDFGGRKDSQAEYASACACRKFAKQTYGIFGCKLDIPEAAEPHLEELYQGLSNLPLMLCASEEWASLQMMGDTPKIFYSNIHEHHSYLLIVPHVPERILNKISDLVDGGKRRFRWLSSDDLADEVLAPRLHSDGFRKWLGAFSRDEWVRETKGYGDGVCKVATSYSHRDGCR